MDMDLESEKSYHSLADSKDRESPGKIPGALDLAPSHTSEQLPDVTQLHRKATQTKKDVHSAPSARDTIERLQATSSSINLHDLPSEKTSPPARPPSLTQTLALDASEITYPEGGLRAYLIVFGSFSGMFGCFGFMNSMGALQAYVSENQLKSASPSAIGWIFSLYIFIAFFGGIQVGPVFDQYGPRALVAAGGVLLVAGVLGLANSTQYAHFIITLSILCGLGTTLIFTPCVTIIAHYFNRRRGAMTGLAATGGSLGGVLFPLILPSLFASIGFAWAMRIMALVCVVSCLVSFTLLRARLSPKKSGGSVLPDFTIFRNVDFALTTAGIFAMEFGLFVPLTFFASWAVDAGLGEEDPAFPFHLLAILNSASFFGRWLPGIAADYVGRFNTLTASMLMSLVFLVTVWLPAILVPAPQSIATLKALGILFALGFGFAFGSGLSLTPVCVSELCDPREYGRWYSTCYSVVSFGCLTGVPIAGAILGDGGTKGWASLIAWTAACYVVSLACFVAARVRRGGWSLRTVV